MKRILILLSVVAAALIAYGALSLEPAKAGCGTESGCGMSHATQQAPATAAEGTRYSCPMHPEVVSDKPGKCPKCGMNLEKTGASTEPSGMPHDLTAQCQRMIEDFTELEDHFEMMMKLTDIDDLAQAMVEHRDMLDQFSGVLAAHERQCRRMAGSTDEESSSGSEHSGHGH